MATKKQNRRHKVRKERRVLNQALDFFKHIGSRYLRHIGYGDGLGRKHVHDHSVTEQD